MYSRTVVTNPAQGLRVKDGNLFGETIRPVPSLVRGMSDAKIFIVTSCQLKDIRNQRK